MTTLKKTIVFLKSDNKKNTMQTKRIQNRIIALKKVTTVDWMRFRNRIQARKPTDHAIAIRVRVVWCCGHDIWSRVVGDKMLLTRMLAGYLTLSLSSLCLFPIFYYLLLLLFCSFSFPAFAHNLSLHCPLKIGDSWGSA